MREKEARWKGLKRKLGRTVVLDEVSRGDAEIALKRLEILNNFPLLELNDKVRQLSAQFLMKSNLPPKASDDAVHIATATVHGLDRKVVEK